MINRIEFQKKTDRYGNPQQSVGVCIKLLELLFSYRDSYHV